ncbi:unnamed protein product [marine sediment metagenome]|uniref:Uncharacterized protein n=1 Tax=marine sediment metagenome TaxID=412755 RepID=X0YN08_9ZZZZ
MLSLSEFGKHRLGKDGLNYWCKECNRERTREWSKTASGIYTTLKAQSKFWNRENIDITRQDFIDWYNAQTKQCVYCGIKEQDLHKVGDTHNNKLDRLTIDRKDNERGYSIDNIVLACHRCNGTKSDLFSYEIMKEIAQKYIKPMWDAQLYHSLPTSMIKEGNR